MSLSSKKRAAIWFLLFSIFGFFSITAFSGVVSAERTSASWTDNTSASTTLNACSFLFNQNYLNEDTLNYDAWEIESEWQHENIEFTDNSIVLKGEQRMGLPITECFDLDEEYTMTVQLISNSTPDQSLRNKHISVSVSNCVAWTCNGEPQHRAGVTPDIRFVQDSTETSIAIVPPNYELLTFEVPLNFADESQQYLRIANNYGGREVIDEDLGVNIEILHISISRG